MRVFSKIALGLSVASAAVMFSVGCSATQSVSEESLGLRKTNLYTEADTTSEKTNYGKSYAGSGHKIVRAFQDAPPMIPHDVDGMLPITINNNSCVGCHMPEVAPAMGATPIPQSHFTDFRPHHNFDGKTFSKAVDNMKNETSIKKLDQLSNARFNCSQCHAPQSDGQLVENNFEADFITKDGANRSSWSGSKLLEGLDTINGK